MRREPREYSLAELRDGTGFARDARFVQVEPDPEAMVRQHALHVGWDPGCQVCLWIAEARRERRDQREPG